MLATLRDEMRCGWSNWVPRSSIWWKAFFLALIFLLSVHAAKGVVITPSITCLDLEKGQCTPYLDLLVFLTELGMDMEVHYTLTKNSAIDGLSSSWSVQSDFLTRLFIRSRNVHFEMPLEYLGRYYNVRVVENVVKWCNEKAFCFDHGLGFVQFILVNDTSVAYDVFSRNGLKMKYEVEVDLNRGNEVAKLVLSDENKQLSWPPSSSIMEAVVVSVLTQTTALEIGSDSVIVVPNSRYKPFVMNRLYLNSGMTKSIGMSQRTLDMALFDLCKWKCTMEFATELTRVLGSKSDDQFMPFRNNTLESVTNLRVLESSNFDHKSQNSMARLALNDKSSIVVGIKLQAASFGVRKLLIKVNVGETGSVFDEEQRLCLYMDVSNSGSVLGGVEALNSKCTFGQDFHYSHFFPSQYIFFESEQKQRIWFKNHRDTFPEFKGSCLFELKYHADVLKVVEIDFDFTHLGLTVNKDMACTPPLIQAEVNGVLVCKERCTEDQVWNKVVGLCEPVDCVSKYKGERNWYNEKIGLCSAVAYCSQYNSSSCIANEIMGVEVEETSRPQSISCENGVLSAGGKECICNPGWTTNPKQVNIGRYCAYKIPDNTLFYLSVKEDQISYPLGQYPMLSIAGIVIGIFAVILTLVLLFRYYRKRSRSDVEEDELSEEELTEEDELTDEEQ